MRNYTGLMVLVGWIFLCFVCASICACGTSVQSVPTDPASVEVIHDFTADLDGVTIAPAPILSEVEMPPTITVIGVASALVAEAQIVELFGRTATCRTNGNHTAWVCQP